MRTISTTITIDATPEEVWATLSDLPRHCTWNPYIREAYGEPVPGERLTLRTYPEAGDPVTLRPRVVAARPGAELRWVRRKLVPGLLDTEHFFHLAEGPGRTTRLEHGERVRGLLAPFLGRLPTRNARDFAAMNEALRARVEAAPTAP
ncbi:SRPBCC family protein [Streptomyces sp. NPDC059382]|uniref:SRPBCC family protein n=1 Tax=Streptomyces sp. NPDC059382 TaxID=3346816 RepID=UPI00368EA566